LNRLYSIIVLLVVAPSIGCQLRPAWLRPNKAELPPQAFAASPTLDEITFAVNANTDRIQQLQTESATLKAEGMPALKADLAYARPNRFRLRAELFQFTGRELDLGSNEEVFWFWARRDTQPAIYFARHRQYATSHARDLIPVEPSRLLDSLGLIRFDPADRHDQPVARDDGRIEVRSYLPTPRGDLTRVVLIDGKYGWVLEQHLYDANGQLLLSAQASKFRFYPMDGVSLPHHIEVQVTPGQPSQMAFEVDVNGYLINRLYGEPTELWSLPNIEGYPLVDIAAPGFQPPVGPPPDTNHPAFTSGYAPPRTSHLPAYRGYNVLR
jgi:hypothetical protein